MRYTRVFGSSPPSKCHWRQSSSGFGVPIRTRHVRQIVGAPAYSHAQPQRTITSRLGCDLPPRLAPVQSGSNDGSRPDHHRASMSLVPDNARYILLDLNERSEISHASSFCLPSSLACPRRHTRARHDSSGRTRMPRIPSERHRRRNQGNESSNGKLLSDACGTWRSCDTQHCQQRTHGLSECVSSRDHQFCIDALLSFGAAQRSFVRGSEACAPQVLFG